jgi:DNA-binding transcriptional LysR family regulator
MEGVVTENYDVGVAPLPISDAAINTALILSHEAVCIAPISHRFKRLRKLEITQLSGEPFLASPIGSPFRVFIDKYLSSVGVTPTIVAEARSQRAICRLVASGAGVSIVDPTIADEIPRQAINVLRLRPALLWSIGALTSRRRTPSHALQALLAELSAKTED